MDIKVSLERPDSIEALNLFDESHRELKARYSADSVEHPFDWSAVDSNSGATSMGPPERAKL
jgi:hypothetical protein